MLAVFILLGAAGLSGIGHSSSSSDSEEAASAGATAEEQICESIDQCAEASPSQDPGATEPTGACPPDDGDTGIAAGADELHTANSLEGPEKEGLLETVGEPFAGAQAEKDGDCADTLTPQNPQQP